MATDLEWLFPTARGGPLVLTQLPMGLAGPELQLTPTELSVVLTPREAEELAKGLEAWAYLHRRSPRPRRRQEA